MVPGNKKPLDEKLSQFVFVQFCIFIIEMSQCLPSGEEWIFHLVPDRQELGVDIDFPSGSNFVTDQTRLTFSLLNYLSLSRSQWDILERPRTLAGCVLCWREEYRGMQSASKHWAQLCHTHIYLQIRFFHKVGLFMFSNVFLLFFLLLFQCGFGWPR